MHIPASDRSSVHPHNISPLVQVTLDVLVMVVVCIINVFNSIGYACIYLCVRVRVRAYVCMHVYVYVGTGVDFILQRV
jgi:hypothetical protein